MWSLGDPPEPGLILLLLIATIASVTSTVITLFVLYLFRKPSRSTKVPCPVTLPNPVELLSQDDFRRLLKARDIHFTTIIDARSSTEFNRSHIKGSVNLSSFDEAKEFYKDHSNLDKTAIVYSDGNMTTAYTMAHQLVILNLAHKGKQGKVYVVDGGLKKYEEEGGHMAPGICHPEMKEPLVSVFNQMTASDLVKVSRTCQDLYNWTMITKRVAVVIEMCLRVEINRRGQVKIQYYDGNQRLPTTKDFKDHNNKSAPYLTVPKVTIHQIRINAKNSTLTASSFKQIVDFLRKIRVTKIGEIDLESCSSIECWTDFVDFVKNYLPKIVNIPTYKHIPEWVTVEVLKLPIDDLSFEHGVAPFQSILASPIRSITVGLLRDVEEAYQMIQKFLHTENFKLRIYLTTTFTKEEYRPFDDQEALPRDFKGPLPQTRPLVFYLDGWIDETKHLLVRHDGKVLLVTYCDFRFSCSFVEDDHAVPPALIHAPGVELEHFDMSVYEGLFD